MSAVSSDEKKKVLPTAAACCSDASMLGMCTSALIPQLFETTFTVASLAAAFSAFSSETSPGWPLPSVLAKPVLHVTAGRDAVRGLDVERGLDDRIRVETLGPTEDTRRGRARDEVDLVGSRAVGDDDRRRRAYAKANA